MPRSHIRETVQNVHGDAIINALGTVYQHGTTTPVTDMYNSESGGVLVPTLVSNINGVIEGWFTSKQTVDIVVSDNNGTAHLDNGDLIRFSAYTVTVEVEPPPVETGEIDTSQTWSGTNTFTGITTFQGDAHFKSGSPWVDVKSYNAMGNGSTDDSTAIQTAVATVGNGDLFFPIGTYKLSSNVSVPSNVTLRFASGAILKPDSGRTITINGTFIAPERQIFDLTAGGHVVAPSISDWYVRWFGAKGDDSHDDGPAIQAALDTARNFGGNSNVVLGAGTFRHSVTLDYYGNNKGITLIGVRDATKEQGSANAACILKWTGGAAAQLRGGSTSKAVGIAFQNWGTATVGIELDDCSYAEVEGCSFVPASGSSAWSVASININGFDYNYIFDCIFEAAPAIRIVDDGTWIHIANSTFDCGSVVSGPVPAIIVEASADLITFKNITFNTENSCYTFWDNSTTTATISKLEIHEMEFDENATVSRAVPLMNVKNVRDFAFDAHVSGFGTYLTTNPIHLTNSVMRVLGITGDSINNEIIRTLDTVSRVITGPANLNPGNTKGQLDPNSQSAGYMTSTIGAEWAGVINLHLEYADPSQHAIFRAFAQNNTDFTINIASQTDSHDPGLKTPGQRFSVMVYNGSGAPMGTGTFGSEFIMKSSPKVSVPNGQWVTYDFIWDGANALEENPVNPWVDVRSFGAKGDGIADDTTALQNAINAAGVAPRGGTVYFPPGTYLISSTLHVKEKPVTLIGAGGLSQDYGTGAVARDSATLIKTTSNITMLWLHEDDYSSVESCGSGVRDMAFSGNKTGGSQIGIRIDVRVQPWLERVQVGGMGSHGIVISDCVSGNFTNCMSDHNMGDGWRIGDPLLVGDVGIGSVTNTQFTSCHGTGSGGNGFSVLGSTSGCWWQACDGESNAGWGWFFKSDVPNSRLVRGNGGNACWDENNTLGGVRFDDSNCRGNNIGFAKGSSNPFVSYAAQADIFNGVGVQSYLGNDPNFISQIPAIKSWRLMGGGVSSGDLDHVAVRSRINDGDGIIRASKFVSSLGISQASPGAITDTHCASSGAYNVPSTRGVNSRNAANSGDYTLIQSDGSDGVTLATGVAKVTLGSGPTMTWGTGPASGTQPSGSIFIRTDGSNGARIYISAGGGTWNAIAGV